MLRHAPRGHCGSSVGSRKANEERLPTTGVGDRSQIVCLGRASWSAGAGCCVFVLLFLAAMRIRRRGIWQWHGEKLWQVAWRVFCSVSGLRPLRLGPAPVLGCACARRCAWFFFCVWPASQQVGASASLCVCSVVLSFAPRLFQLFRLLPTLSGSSLPCSGMVERACLVARALVLTSDGSSAPATGLLGVGSQPMWR